MIVRAVALGVVRRRGDRLLVAVDLWPSSSTSGTVSAENTRKKTCTYLKEVKEQLDLVRDLARRHAPLAAPLLLEVEEDAVGAELVDLSEGSEARELRVRHLHVDFVALDLLKKIWV